jgi:hypothetical protein
MPPDVEDWCELKTIVESGSKAPLVVQFGTRACALCPDASKRIHRLTETHQFEWHYMDATLSQLAEALEVTRRERFTRTVHFRALLGWDGVHR